MTPDCTLTLPVGPPAFNRNYRYNDGAAYAQDSWKILPRLTLNLGLRWEYFGVQHNADPALDSNFVFGPGPNEFHQIRNGAVQLASDGGVFWKPDYKNFGPRVGFAYDIFGDGKTSLRGGYGISYERNFGNVTFNAIQNPPNYGVVSLVTRALILSTEFRAATFRSCQCTPTLLVLWRAREQKPCRQSASAPLTRTSRPLMPKLGIFRLTAISVKGVFSVAYAGSHGMHLYDIANINNTTGGGSYLGDAKPSTASTYQYSNMNFRSDHGYSHYNALNLSYQVTNLLHKGLGMSANYTLSHSLDNLSSTFTDGTASFGDSLGYLDAFNPKIELWEFGF